MKAAFHTLGCKVNQYETEAMKEQFKSGGYEIVPDDEFADVYIINTCTVTNLADRKSRQFIRRARKNNPNALVAVTGCYAQLKPDEIAAIEGVQIIAGTDEKRKIKDLVEEYFNKDQSSKFAVLPYEQIREYEEFGSIREMESRTRAFIKIQDGCNNFCTYCLIPYARGRIRSRNEDEIVREVTNLVKNGYKEIVLTGINTAFYGKEQGRNGIEPLIAKLNAIEGDFRIRLSSLEPTVIDAEYVKDLLKYDKLCHHLHLALQSGSDNILERMKRGYTREDFMTIVKVLREFDPHYGISTDIIVGFPGETEEDFLDSMSIVEECEFCKVHVFKYSKREGTKAAVMPDQILPELKAERSHRLIELSEKVSKKFRDKCIGMEEIVLSERFGVDPISGELQGKENSDGAGGVDSASFDKSVLQKGLITGYTGNYIKSYMHGTEDLFNRFENVRITGRYLDGVMVENLK